MGRPRTREERAAAHTCRGRWTSSGSAASGQEGSPQGSPLGRESRVPRRARWSRSRDLSVSPAGSMARAGRGLGVRGLGVDVCDARKGYSEAAPHTAGPSEPLGCTLAGSALTELADSGSNCDPRDQVPYRPVQLISSHPGRTLLGKEYPPLLKTIRAPLKCAVKSSELFV